MSSPGELLKQAETHLNAALAALDRGDDSRARLDFIEASRALFLAAKDTPPGESRARRAAQAQALMDRAEELSAGRPGPLAGAAGRDFSADIAGVTFADVAGLEAVKEEIRLKLIYPVAYPERAKKYGLKPGGGLLLYGPPGTGKTLLARAVAGEVKAPFLTARPSDLMDKYVGESEKGVAALFAEARRHPLAVIFLDEIEALIPDRDTSGGEVAGRVVSQFLSEMEGVTAKKGRILFLGATNKPWQLDAAMLRPGRFDEKVYIPLPDAPAREVIFQLQLKGKHARGLDYPALAAKSEGLSGADLRNVCQKACGAVFLETLRQDKERPVEQADILAALREVRPSVNREMLARYEAYARE